MLIISSEVFDLKLKTKKDFEQGIQLYQNSKFAEASGSFRKVLEENPEDRAAGLYIKRCRSFEKNGIPANWEGVTAFDEK